MSTHKIGIYERSTCSTDIHFDVTPRKEIVRK